MGPRASASGGASSFGVTKRNGPQASVRIGTRDSPSGSKSGSRSERGAARSVPSRSYVHAWYGHCSDLPEPSPSTISDPRWRQTLRNARTPSSARTTSTGTSPAQAAKRSPTFSTCPSWPTYCHARRKIRSCSRRRTSGSEYQLQGRLWAMAANLLRQVRQFPHLGDRRRQEKEEAGHRTDDADPERRLEADRGAEEPAHQGTDGPDAVVHDHVRAGHARPEPVRDERGEDRGGGDVEDHHPEPGAELREEQHRQDQPVGPARERHEHERHREEDAAEDVRRPDPERPPQARGHERADQPADRPGTEDDPERRRPDAQRANRVQDE